ncbi:MFS transporter [Brevibacillus sp. SAFN-007a]|uniref:MFS transporter n=1 Tax=Brevibacillus sp. SAFN-007a TaxID=3436862 RepID=UPI003F8134CD
MSLSFYSLWAGQSLENVAGSFYTIALITLVYHITGSATFAASISLVRVIAKFLSSFLVPLIFDRYPLQRILLFSQAAQMMIVIVLTLLVIFHNNSGTLVVIYVLVFMAGYFDGWAVPSRNALVPRLVQENKLVKANSLLSTSDQSLGLLGWTLGGGMVVYFGEENVLWLTVGLFFLSTLSIIFIKDDSKKVGKQPLRWDSVKEGWVAIYRNPKLRLVTIMDIIEGIAGGIWIGAITLVFVKEVLHRGEEWWGYINASYYVGSIIGGLVMMSISKKVQNRLTTSMIIGSFSVCILIFAYSLIAIPLLSLLFVLLMGPFYQVRDIAQRTYFQKHTQNELQPKVFSAQSSLYYAVFSFSVFLMGAITDLLGVRMVYILAGILYLISSILALSSKVKEHEVKAEA